MPPLVLPVVCPQLQANGVCNDRGCSFKHDVTFCDACQCVITSREDYAIHVQSRPHKAKVSGRSGDVFCPLCRKKVPISVWSQHIRGRRHQSHVTSTGALGDLEPEEVPVEDGQMRCDLCNIVVSQADWSRHVTRVAHRRREQFISFRSVFDEASKDKHGVVMSHTTGLDFDVIEPEIAVRGIRTAITVKTTTPGTTIKIIDIKLASSHSSFRSPTSYIITPLSFASSTIRYAQETRIVVTFRQAYEGRAEDRLEITFEDPALRQRFMIIRLLKATVGNKAEYDAIKPTSPYVPKKRTKRTMEREVVPGVPPPAVKVTKWVVRLPQAFIPSSITSVLFSGSVANIIEQLRRTVLPSTVDIASYARFFKALLWIEENQMENDLQIYDIDDAVLTKHFQYYYVTVPGLAEKRPSVLTGDRMHVQRHGTEDSGRWFEGHVHVLRKEEVGLCFHSSFPVPPLGQRYNVRFKLNRIPLQRQHQALDTAFASEYILFPKEQHIVGLQPVRTPITPYSPLIGQNIPQMEAVRAITYRPAGSVPFIVFGPPGTGKTVTVVEAMRQLLKVNPDARILACAPSNSAADLIASKLTVLGTDKLFRYYAPSRPKDSAPDDLTDFTYKNLDGYYSLPPMSVLRRFKVIVATCVSASFAHNIGIPRGHFSHIFVDEAGQATEPETMIAIKTMADLKTNVVLSGDPKQLGPIIRSSVARKLKLDISFLERLMESDIYNERARHGRTVVKLTKNYRSHHSILRYPNDRFYNGDLVPCGDKNTIDSFLGSPLLVSKTFPILFHAMSGKDNREASSPSFFNIEEVLQVKRYVEKLRSSMDRRFRVADKDIGIIAPYHAQCLKIRNTLRGVADGVKVGSVEEFQGQERRVIIISTVRSSREFVEYDLKHTLGFVANPRRFNVAVTRAQALLIVVGDPTVLSLDPLWRSFLNYIHKNNGWTGVPISWNSDEVVRDAGGYDAEYRDLGLADMNDFTRRMEAMTLGGVGDADNGVGEAEANVDRPWREVE